ncbi:MAG: hypothetical protein SO101_14325 [Lachnospiraceae bacterium]|nr:hypothetical protein [Lachnospiraceae bacterium]
MRKYNPFVDVPSCGWDQERIENYLSTGTELFVDDNEVWTADKSEYAGRIITSVTTTATYKPDTDVFLQKRHKNWVRRKTR